jgi:phosphatidylglycerophosphate synthase
MGAPVRKSPYTAADFKASKPAVMGPVEVLFNRRLSTLLTRLLVRTPLTPNQVTVLSFLVLLPGAYLLSTGERIALIGAGFLIQLSFTLDCCDGELARLRGLSSPFGAWLDGLLDRIAELVLCLALGVALEHQSDDPHAYLYSFVAFASLAMTHIATLMNATAFGKGQLAESAGRGLVGRLAGFVRIPPLKLRNYLRSGIDVYLLVFALGAVFDQLMGVVYYFAVVQNLYWLAIVSMVVRQKK